jgi:hypothetical protein
MNPHTIDYAVFGARRVLADERSEILLCQALMNRRFTWTGSGLNLFLPFDKHVLTTLSSSLPVRGAGRTRVFGDEWNAFLVVRFLEWLSRRLPEHEVRVHDSGGFLSVSDVVLRDGVAHRARAVERGVPAHGEGLRMPAPPTAPAVLERLDGRFYESVAASLYADVPEIAASPISREELAVMTLDDIAERFLFPWDTERLSRFRPSA